MKTESKPVENSRLHVLVRGEKASTFLGGLSVPKSDMKTKFAVVEKSPKETSTLDVMADLMRRMDPPMNMEARTVLLTMSERTARVLRKIEDDYGEPLTVDRLINRILDSEMEIWRIQPETREWALVAAAATEGSAE